MRNAKLKLVFALCFAAIQVFSGCQDPCKDVVCLHGTCADGKCQCELGYEGIDCGTAVNAKFSGTFNLTETCTPSGGPFTYPISVAPLPNSANQFTMTGLWYISNLTVSGRVGEDGLGWTIPRQDIDSTLQIMGNGTITSDSSFIIIRYDILQKNSIGVYDGCVGSMEK